MVNDLTIWIGGFLFSVLGYFLKDTMENLKECKKDMNDLKLKVAENKSELDVLKTDHQNKHDSLNEKFDELKGVLKDLTREVKSLTLEISKKKD